MFCLVYLQSEVVAKRTSGRETMHRRPTPRETPQPNQGKDIPWITFGKKKMFRNVEPDRKHERRNTLVLKLRRIRMPCAESLTGRILSLIAGRKCQKHLAHQDWRNYASVEEGGGQKGHSYKALAQKVLDKKVQVIALTTEPTLQCKNLEEITDAQELAAVLKQHRSVCGRARRHADCHDQAYRR